MDGLTEIQKLQRDALLAAGKKLSFMYKHLCKSSAINRIKMQPFFDKPFFENKGDTIKIRRPI